MRIESQSLSAYLFSRGIVHQEPPPAPLPNEIEEIWRDILRFPGESWSPEEGENEEAILDPGRVLGRMFCVKMDRYLSSYLKTARHEKRQMGITIPISWLLRLAPDENWAPGEVLLYAEKKSGGLLDEEIREIRKFFPTLFNNLSEKAEQESCIKRLNELFIEKWAEFKERELIHISAPKFHKSWTNLVGNDREKEEDARIAKQQWSMSVDGSFEKLCLASEGGCDVIQSGGGHVLLLAPKDSEPETIAKKELKFIRKEFLALEGRGWSPLLWASWDPNSGKGSDGQCVLPSKIETEVESGISDLCIKYRVIERARYIVKENWALFKYGRESNTQRKTGNPAVLYLDVIGLGEHCWPKTKDEKKEDYQGDTPPYRKRSDAISGFIKSRNITAVIESTFGLIFAKHHPEKVMAMGGDEIIMKMDASEWLGVVINIEEHCKKLHATIFDENARLLWWAMCSDGDSAPDSEIIDRLKNQYRKLTDDKRVQLMRFVNPMWTNIGSEEERYNILEYVRLKSDKSFTKSLLTVLGTEGAELPGYDEEKEMWVDWSSELTVEKLADDLFDTKEVPMFNAKMRKEMVGKEKTISETITNQRVWEILMTDIFNWRKVEYDKLSENEKGIHTGNLRAWTTLLEDAVEEVWKRTGFKNNMSKKMKTNLRNIACCFLTRKYEMKSSDFKTWKN